ncbi:MAG: homoserine kinase [Gammaproteobacteria bacterium]
MNLSGTELRGIADGIENTNYFFSTERGTFILTLFENSIREDLSYPFKLTRFLSERGIPCARPIESRSAQVIGRLHEKPAVIVERLPGEIVEQPKISHLVIVGTMLARFHRLGLEFDETRCDPEDTTWLCEIASIVRDRLSISERNLLDTAIRRRRSFDKLRLPRGVIHSDLFRDNVLFAKNRLSGLIDFYDAHKGPLVYDLAVTVCDWCIDELGNLNTRAAASMVQAYSRVRRLNVREKQVWAESVRAAALRFWLSRKKDQLYTREGTLTQSKDPDKFAVILQASNNQPNTFHAPLESENE